MKRIISLLLICLMVFTAGCSQEGTSPAPNNTSAPSDAPVISSEPTEQPESPLSLLTLNISTEGILEWGDYTPLCESTWQILEADTECALRYPALAARLETLNADTRKQGEMFIADNLSWAQELAAGNEYFYGLTFTDEYSALRADELILSIRGHVSSYTGGVHPNYGAYGINIDPKSGETVQLTDIMTETDGLADILANKLREKYPEEPFTSLPEMLADYELENYSWTLSYQGLTFYFSPYEIASYAAGLLTVTIWFDEAPQLFNTEYTKVPEQGYAIALPTAYPLEFDLDPTDGKRDEITVSYTSVDGTGLLQPIITRNGEQLSDTDGYMYEMQPYLVHTNGKTYIYIEGVIENDYHTLSVYDLNNTDISVVGRVYDSGFSRRFYEAGEYSGYLTLLFNDPEEFALDTRFHILGTLRGTKHYRVNPADGMPAEKTAYYELDTSIPPLTSIIPIEVEILPEGSFEKLDSGTQFRFLRTDGESYVDMLLEDGRECRIALERDSDTWEWYINGVSEWDCFEMLLYAG